MSNKNIIRTFSTTPNDCETVNKACPLCGSVEEKSFGQLNASVFVTCKKCGLIRQNPQPLSQSVIERYSDDSYLEYEKNNHIAYRQIALMSLEEAGFDCKDSCAVDGTKKSVLDIGCATGALLALLKENNWQCHGLEVSRHMSEYGKKQFGLDILNCRLEEANFSEASFDVIIASHLIEHLNEPVAFLENVYKILKNDSCFYLITPNSASLQAFLMKDKWRSVIEDHLYLFSVKTLKEMLLKTGFAVDYVGTWGGLPSGMRPRCMKKIIDSFAKKTFCGDVMIIKARKIGD